MRIQKATLFFSQLINLEQKGSMMEHIEGFQKLNIRIKHVPEEHKIYVFIRTLKDNMQHEVFLWQPDSLEKAFRWLQGSLPLTIIKMEVFLPLAIHNLQD